MRQYNAENLIVHPGNVNASDVIVEVTPELAGWEYVSFQLRQLAARRLSTYATGENELAIVVLSGRLNVVSDRGHWSDIGERDSVFSGLPSALYLPRHTTFTISAQTDCEYALALAPTDQDHEPRLVTPSDVATEIRGGDQATRQINSILSPGFPCHRLVIVEVYTPGGNWSSYPPHKHDIHKADREGRVLEADLEEVYFYKIDRPEGFALQRVYTDPESPLHQAGLPIDAVLLARNNDVVLVPEGYHPVTCPPGYNAYYLNVLAGSAQSLANSEDSNHAWVKEYYQSRDARVPFYKINTLL